MYLFHFEDQGNCFLCRENRRKRKVGRQGKVMNNPILVGFICFKGYLISGIIFFDLLG